MLYSVEVNGRGTLRNERLSNSLHRDLYSVSGQGVSETVIYSNSKTCKTCNFEYNLHEDLSSTLHYSPSTATIKTSNMVSSSNGLV